MLVIVMLLLFKVDTVVCFPSELRLSLQRSFSGCCSSLRLEFLCDALPAPILLRLVPSLRCELQSDALSAAILLRLLLTTAHRTGLPRFG